MAPVYWASRLSLLWLLVWLSALFLNCYTLLIYNRQALLDIRNSVATSFTNTLDVHCSFNKTDEPFTLAIPGHIRRWPLNIPRKKRRRKRGNRGGYFAKLKAHLRAGLLLYPSHESFYGGSTTWCPRGIPVASSCSPPAPEPCLSFRSPPNWPRLPTSGSNSQKSMRAGKSVLISCYYLSTKDGIIKCPFLGE